MYAAQGTCTPAVDDGVMAGSRFPHRVKIDTRLVAAVQARAGARTHEAAGLLNRYHLWAAVLIGVRRPADSFEVDALRQFNAAKVRLREFLSASPLAVEEV